LQNRTGQLRGEFNMSREILLSLFLYGCSFHAVAATPTTELQDPIIVEPSAGVILPKPATGCPVLPPPPAGVTAAHLVVQYAFREIGPFRVNLAGYTFDQDASPSYRPIVLHANPGSSLLLDLDNQTDTEVTNLHTHGLIVRPRPVKVVKANAPCLPGDYVFLRTGQSSAGGGDLRQLYRIDIPEQLPASLFDHTGRDEPYPAGLAWFHAHMHGVARPQVTMGMSGLLSIGDPKAYLIDDSSSEATKALREQTDVKYLGLRDIQLWVKCADTFKSGDKAGDCSSPPPGMDGPPGAMEASDAGAQYDPALCASSSVSGRGWCYAPNPDPNDPTNTDKRTADRYWLFTVGGQVNPTITVAPKRNHLWRIANLSANVTYVLKLCADDTVDCTGKDNGLRPMTVVTVDGVVTGERANSTQSKVGVQVDKLLMMPGSRAEVFISNAVPSEQAQQFVLRTEGMNTGPGPTIGGVGQQTGDQWPAITLATVVMNAAVDKTLLASVRPPQLSWMMPAVVPTPAVRASREASSRLDCSFLPPDTPTKKYRRQVVFEEDNATSSFRLGSQRVDQDGGLEMDGRNIAPAEFAHNRYNYTGDDFPIGLHACATLHRGEVWELVNTTDELHNFHIHQGKFRLARAEDRGMRPSGKPVDDPLGMLTALMAEGAGSAMGRDVWHDTLPVPPRNGPNFGRIFIFIPFEAEQQLGRFVFHCHILEHEDHGMMAAVEVVRQMPESDEEPVVAKPESGVQSDTHHHRH
jgi:FtsP/CotA-like multicopper oxidase with cupredoxin domain